MVTINPNNTIFSLLSALLGVVVTDEDYVITNPVARLGLYNTEVTLKPKLAGRFYAQHSIKYNRINIGSYSPIYIDRTNAIRVSDLLASINLNANFGNNISISYLDRKINFTVPPLLLNDVVNSLVPQNTQQSFYLQINPNSFLFTGVALLATIKPAVFISFEVVVKEPVSTSS